MWTIFQIRPGTNGKAQVVFQKAPSELVQFEGLPFDIPGDQTMDEVRTLALNAARAALEEFVVGGWSPGEIAADSAKSSANLHFTKGSAHLILSGCPMTIAGNVRQSQLAALATSAAIAQVNDLLDAFPT